MTDTSSQQIRRNLYNWVPLRGKAEHMIQRGLWILLLTGLLLVSGQAFAYESTKSCECRPARAVSSACQCCCEAATKSSTTLSSNCSDCNSAPLDDAASTNNGCRVTAPLELQEVTSMRVEPTAAVPEVANILPSVRAPPRTLTKSRYLDCRRILI